MNAKTIRDALSEYEGVDRAELDEKIFEILIDLCEKTFLVTQTITLLTTAGTYEYTLSPSGSWEVAGLPRDAFEVASVNTPNPTAADGTSGTLVAGTTYYYKVTAYLDDYGETLPCDAVSHTVPAAGEVVLDWDDIDGCTGYKVYRATAAAGPFYLLKDELTSSTYDDDGTDSVTTTKAPTKSNLMKAVGQSNESLERDYDTHWKDAEATSITRILFDGDKTIRLNRVPTETNIGIQVKTAVIPTAMPGTFPTILNKHRWVILNGVRWLLNLMPKTDNRPWPDLQRAAYYKKQYRLGVQKIKAKTMHGHGGVSQARYRFWAA